MKYRFSHHLKDGRFTEVEQAMITDYLLLTYEEDDYSDNLCIARSWVPEDVDALEQSRARGCCGRQEGGVDSPRGTIYIGYNYGH